MNLDWTFSYFITLEYRSEAVMHAEVSGVKMHSIGVRASAVLMANSIQPTNLRVRRMFVKSRFK